MNTGRLVKNRILELCEEHHITVNKLCTICGITQSTLNNIVNDKSQNPTISTIKKICDGLNITLCEFFNTDAFNESEQEIK